MAAAAVAGDEGEVGQWGPVIDWPVVGIHMALLQNGKVLAYDSSADQLGVDDHSFTRATVWDPTSGSHVDAMLIGLQHLLQRPRPSDGRDAVHGGRQQERRT